MFGVLFKADFMKTAEVIHDLLVVGHLLSEVVKLLAGEIGAVGGAYRLPGLNFDAGLYVAFPAPRR